MFFKKYILLIFILISLIYCQKLDTRCIVPNTRPTQNLPHETNCSEFYKCHNGFLLLLSCPRGKFFNAASSSCLSEELTECFNFNVTLPTPPLRISTTVGMESSSVIIPSAPIVNESTMTAQRSSTIGTTSELLSLSTLRPTPPLISPTTTEQSTDSPTFEPDRNLRPTPPLINTTRYFIPTAPTINAK